MSGVAVNPQEFSRAQAFLPNVGTGIFDGDSPTEFRTKVDDLEAFTLAAKWRYENIIKNDKYRRDPRRDAAAFNQLHADIPLSKDIPIEGGGTKELYLHEFDALYRERTGKPNASTEEVLAAWRDQ